MNVFDCPVCRNTIYFENISCERCGSQLGFVPSTLKFGEVEGAQKVLGSDPGGKSLPYCRNQAINLCNWIVEDEGNTFCRACKLNRKIPGVEDADTLEKWKRLEMAKHRLVYQLLKMGLPLDPKNGNSDNGVAFDFLSEDNSQGVLTGHANGVVTIILSEADSVHREQLRKQMSEPYRTLLGHFRHEIGHYYWPILVTENHIQEYRKLFGDERKDYGDCLKTYYEKGAPPGWQENFVSAYATSHSWEDWAETWAHFLHLMDTLETASAMKIAFGKKPDTSSATEISPNPYKIDDFRAIYEHSFRLMRATNSLNRSMGLPDIYPFIISKPVLKKMVFINQLLISYRK